MDAELTCALGCRCVVVGWDVDTDERRGFSLGQRRGLSRGYWGWCSLRAGYVGWYDVSFCLRCRTVLLAGCRSGHWFRCCGLLDASCW
jgi:hypothetical protein